MKFQVGAILISKDYRPEDDYQALCEITSTFHTDPNCHYYIVHTMEVLLSGRVVKAISYETSSVNLWLTEDLTVFSV